MTTFNFYADRTITLAGKAMPFARIDRDSFEMPSGQRGETTVRIYETGEEIKMRAPLYIPAVKGSVSDWKVNPAFEAELQAAIEA